jgi:hypothetical protein
MGMMSNHFPHEFMIDGVYFSPLIVVFFISLVLAMVSVMILNKLHISRYFFHPPLAFVAIVVLYMLMIDSYFIKI